jgi:hypothetical protein
MVSEPRWQKDFSDGVDKNNIESPWQLTNDPVRYFAPRRKTSIQAHLHT